MPVYLFESPSGRRKELFFEFGTAPRKIGRFERIVIFPQSVVFKGGMEAGWTRHDRSKEQKVSWSQVEKWTKQADELADKTEKDRLKNDTRIIAEAL